MQSENHPRRSRGHLQWAAVLMERGGASGAEPLVQRVGAALPCRLPPFHVAPLLSCV